MTSGCAGVACRHFASICSEKSPVLIKMLSTSVPTIETPLPRQLKRVPPVDGCACEACDGTLRAGAAAATGKASGRAGCGARLSCEETPS